MTVLLRRSGDLPPTAAYDVWFHAASACGRRRDPVDPPAARKLPQLGRRLEAAFDAVCPEWLKVGKALADDPGAELAYVTTCATYASDFGQMMAWSRLAGELAQESVRCLVVCDDPWLFRHLAEIPGVAAGAPPPLWPTRTKLWARGVLARLALIPRLSWATLASRGQRRHHAPGDAVILVYGHPASDTRGYDDYFGPMMREIPTLKRAMHTDCGAAQARALAADGRTASLHAWGRIGWTPGLLFVRWRPRAEHRRGPLGWLVRRAAAVEGSGGAHPMNIWQRRCQEAWLNEARPKVVAWPWENQGWERGLSRQARRFGVRTAGYQHVVIGPHQLIFSPATNRDGAASLPDTVVCDGVPFRDHLARLGVPSARLAIGGSLRIGRIDNDLYDSKGPVFVALAARQSIAGQQMAAVEKAAAQGFRFLIKGHPMYPMDFQETDGVRRTTAPLAKQTGLSAVFYATGTTGLEALLAGLPAFRILPEDEIAINSLPDFIAAERVTADGLAAALVAATKPAPFAWERVLSEVDWPFWRRLFAGDVGATSEAAGRKERIA